jgi:hypothetical protein
MEDIRMQFLELNSAVTDALHPASVPNVLRDKRSPNGDGFERATTSGRLETNTSRVLILEDTEGVEVRVILNLPSIFLGFARLEEVIEACRCGNFVLALHCYHGAVEEHHSLV